MFNNFSLLIHRQTSILSSIIVIIIITMFSSAVYYTSGRTYCGPIESTAVRSDWLIVISCVVCSWNIILLYLQSWNLLFLLCTVIHLVFSYSKWDIIYIHGLVVTGSSCEQFVPSISHMVGHGRCAWCNHYTWTSAIYCVVAC